VETAITRPIPVGDGTKWRVDTSVLSLRHTNQALWTVGGMVCFLRHRGRSPVDVAPTSTLSLKWDKSSPTGWKHVLYEYCVCGMVSGPALDKGASAPATSSSPSPSPPPPLVPSNARPANRALHSFPFSAQLPAACLCYPTKPNGVLRVRDPARARPAKR